MPLVHTEEFALRYSECDRNGRMKLKTFFDFAQDVAGVHASRIGVGVETLAPLRQAWMLSRIRVRLAEYPAIGETVSVATWPSGFEHLFARREFRFSTPRLGEFARASSGWLLVDVDKMRILPSERLYGKIIPSGETPERIFQELDKLTPAKQDDTNTETRKIQPTQIDINGHLNNAEYAGILQDALGIGRYPGEFQLNYQKSVPPDSMMAVSKSLVDNHFAVTGRVNGAVAFESEGDLMAQ